MFGNKVSKLGMVTTNKKKAANLEHDADLDKKAPKKAKRQSEKGTQGKRTGF
jgi:hypothetical protein